MDQLLTDNVGRAVGPVARTCEKRIAALAYVSAASHLPFKAGDMLVCDASDSAVSCGETSATALAGLSKKVVHLCSLPGLHAKVVVMGSKALIGSTNLSDSSANRLREAALLTARPSVVSQAKAFVHLVKNEATAIDPRFLARILRIRVVRRQGVRAPRRVHLKQLGSRFWVAWVRELHPDRYQDEEPDVARAIADARRIAGDDSIEPEWLRFTGTSRFRSAARPGDTVVRLWAGRDGRRITVWSPAAILLRRDRRHWTRFYYDPNEDLQGMPWRQFERHLQRLGVKSITKHSVRELTKRDTALVETIWDR
jgi:hypothetical protein